MFDYQRVSLEVTENMKAYEASNFLQWFPGF